MVAVNPEKFVNRKEELAIIKDRITRMAKGNPFSPKERVIHFIGPSGIGKTCLLQECHRMVSEDLREKSISIRFENLNTRNLRDHLIELDTTLFRYLRGHQVNVNENSLQRINHSILTRLESNLGDKAFVILVDEVDSLPSAYRKDVEVYLCAHLLKHARTLLLLAGRTAVKWTDFSLASQSTNTFALSPFDINITKEQLGLETPNSTPLAREIVELGGGIPRNNKKLAHQAVGTPPEIQNTLQAVQSLLADILNEIENRFHPVIETICVLPSFIPDEVAPLLACHPSLEDKWREWTIQEMFADLNKVQIGPGGLIHWDSKQRSWVMDEPTRALFERELKMRSPELWRKLHCTAHQMYTKWGDEFGSKIYRDKAAYHLECLQSVGMACNDQEG